MFKIELLVLVYLTNKRRTLPSQAFALA